MEGKAVSDVEALRLALMMVMRRGTFGSVLVVKVGMGFHAACARGLPTRREALGCLRVGGGGCLLNTGAGSDGDGIRCAGGNAWERGEGGKARRYRLSLCGANPDNRRSRAGSHGTCHKYPDLRGVRWGMGCGQISRESICIRFSLLCRLPRQVFRRTCTF